MKNRTGLQALKTVAREKYAWPGGYALSAITSDGGLICSKCCRDEYRTMYRSTRDECGDGWQVKALICSADYDGPEYCSYCSNEIE